MSETSFLNREPGKSITNKLDLTTSETNRLIQPMVIRALQSIQRGELEQQVLERALGKALLLKMAGKEVDLLEVYKGLGGGDPVISAVLEGKVNEAFKELDVLPGIQAARESALSERINSAAKGKGQDLEGNMLTTLPGQALNTLAELGGAEFSAKYKTDRL